MKKTVLPAGLALSLLLTFAASAAEAPKTLLVVPSRLRMIQLAFDMQSLRQAEVVCWRPGSNPETPELHYWTGQKWEPLSLEQFLSGARLARRPDKTLFLGLDTPEVLTESPLPGIARFETFDTAMLVNNLDAFYAFTEAEWRLLAGRYGFILRDTNARVRQQNRFANPPPEEPVRRRKPIRFRDEPAPAKILAPETAVVAPDPQDLPVALEPITVESAPVEAPTVPAVTPPAPAPNEAPAEPAAAPTTVESAPVAAPATP